jgi:hypothetical protein
LEKGESSEKMGGLLFFFFWKRGKVVKTKRKNEWSPIFFFLEKGESTKKENEWSPIFFFLEKGESSEKMSGLLFF